jgi:hypothetical protein
MSGCGNRHDKAVMKSFLSTVKFELGKHFESRGRWCCSRPPPFGIGDVGHGGGEPALGV